MICINIIGGLGNQMFQYAQGRAIAKASGLTVVYTDDMFASYKTTHNGSELERVFALSLNKITERQLASILGRVYRLPAVRRAANHRLFRRAMPRAFLHEDDFQGSDALLTFDQGSDYYLQGYWQNFHDVDLVRDEILKDFTFSKPLSGFNQALAMQMSEAESVSLHVRRGDYVANPKANSKHGVLPLDYYLKAIGLIKAKIGSADFRVFAFSDDLEWVASTLKPLVPNLILVEGNARQNANFDMHLMSRCKHHIICNSTFSWWGAWLGQTEGGMVIAPDKWFADGSDASALIPNNWYRL